MANVFQRRNQGIQIVAINRANVIKAKLFKQRGGHDQSLGMFFKAFGQLKQRGRAFEHACRLAATLAAFEEKAFLDLDSAEAGVELMEFYLAQRLALELGSNSKNSQQIKVAAKVAEWLRRQEEDVAHNRLTKFGPKCYRDLTIDEREGVIKEMLNRNSNIVLTEIDTGGIRKEVRYVVQVGD